MKTVPNCPLAEVRWLALLPDPVTGLDQPVTDDSHQPLTWSAPNREYAIRLVRRDLNPRQVRLMSVISVVDWESRRSYPQRSKLSLDDMKAHGVNPRQRCWHCGAATRTKDARYCDPHRNPTMRRQSAAGGR